ncbi:MAG: type 4a pilus biogenesis protein PilO [Planctomycetota bacterium]|nr:type 4a pilus biogenesis protein PilO [Planctomycetota bacterium]
MRFGTREIIFFIVLMAVPIASFFYYFKPNNERINNARDEIQVKQAQLNRLEAITDRLDDLGLAIANGRESISLIEQKLPDEEGVDDILEQIWQSAKRNKQTVKSIKSKSKVPAAMFMELPLDMVMEGNFDGFYQFILELEKLPRITRVHNLSVARVSSTTSGSSSDEVPPGTARAEFTLSIYYESRTVAAAN